MGLIYLALDTATERPTLAVGTPLSPGDDIVVQGRRDLSRDIERLTERILEQRGVGLEALSGIVAADGPGSFTGLRIGVAFAKGACRALGIPLLTAPSLLGAARAACAGEGTVVAQYDALRGETYRAVYRFSTSPAGTTEIETLLMPQIVAAGTGSDVGDSVLRAGPEHASAAALISLVGLRGGASIVSDPAAWQPAYGRPAEAEARLRAAHGRL